MRDYFKRLKNHSGLGTATMFTIIGGLAGMTNKSIQNPLHGFLFGAVFMGVICFGMVLLSNKK